jgi:hypothetical protein
MAMDRAVELALCAWRDAERRLAETAPGTIAHDEAKLAVDQARAAYATAAARRYDAVGQLAELWPESRTRDAARAR